jgi:hypothetical protein
MSFDFDLDTNSTIKVIVHKDSAIKNVTEAVYEQYLKDLDEDKLSIEGEPTRFVKKKNLPYKETKRILDHQVGLDENKGVKLNMSFMHEEVRSALVGIEGPGADKFKMIGGRASDDIINALVTKGVISDLYAARRNSISDTLGDEIKND